MENSVNNSSNDINSELEANVLPSNNPLQVRNVALVIISTILVIYALHWAQSFIITMLLGVLLAYALDPLVSHLENNKVNRVIGSTLVILTVIVGIGYSGYALRGQVQSIIHTLPEATTKLTSLFASKRGQPLSNIQIMQIAANQVETVANSGEENNSNKRKTPMRVIVEEHKFKISDFLWRGYLGLFGFLAETITMIFLAYFLLLSGDSFKRKLVRITGPTLTRKKITVNILDDISVSIQRYLMMLVITNVIVGLISWGTFKFLGLDNAGAWGFFAGFMHIIPYFGPFATAAVTGMAAYMQFDNIFTALMVAGASILIATIIGVFVTTWMTGRIAKMNSAAVFISLIFFSWLWGLWGMLLGIPVIFILKVVCERIEHLQPVAELLGE
ncbi:MAG: AI-2E family transporter [Pseudomonadota bacterium]